VEDELGRLVADPTSAEKIHRPEGVDEVATAHPIGCPRGRHAQAPSVDGALASALERFVRIRAPCPPRPSGLTDANYSLSCRCHTRDARVRSTWRNP
jgi:hypothetical protein